MRLFKGIASVVVFFSLGLAAHAQISHGGRPLPEVLDAGPCLRSGSGAVRMPSFDVEEMLREDSLNEKNIGLHRFARKFDVDYSPENSGAVYHLKDGRNVWRLHIISEGAYSLNLVFDEYQLDSASQLFIYTPDRSSVIGSFTAENNSSHGVLATAPLPGEEVVVELITPKESSTRLKVGSVNHDYRGLRNLPLVGSSAECEVDASCLGSHERQRRSSVVYIVDGNGYCSGTMVNNTANDGTPYMMTSSHCFFTNNGVIKTEKAERSVFFFNFDRPHCQEMLDGSLEQCAAGSEIVFHQVRNDAVLLKLNDKLPLDYRVYYAGWNATETASEPVYCFHHPNSDMTKVSMSGYTPYISTFEMDDIFDENAHWFVDLWDLGIMEAGSSGAGLFDSNDRVIGSLSGGDNMESCDLPGYDAFWALSRVWSMGIKDFLDPIGSGREICDGREADSSPCARLSNWGVDDEIHVVSEYEQYAAGHNNKGIVEYAEHFQLDDDNSVLYGSFFDPWEGIFSDGDTILMRIYSGDSLPETVIGEEIVSMYNLNYRVRSTDLEEKPVTQMSMKDNYYRLRKPLVVGSSFFVGLKLVSSPKEKFALCHTDGKSDGKNTAFFKDSSGWHSFAEAHPYFRKPTSLFIEPVVRLGSSEISLPEGSKVNANYLLSPNPVVDEACVSFPSTKMLLYYELIDMDGRLVRKVDVGEMLDSVSLKMDCQPGVYCLRLVFDSSSESLMLVKE